MEAAVLNTSPIPDTNNNGLCLIFRVLDRLCALSLGHVVETMRPLPIEPLAAAPHFVLGLATIRGSQVPVVDAGRLIG